MLNSCILLWIWFAIGGKEPGTRDYFRFSVDVDGNRQITSGTYIKKEKVMGYSKFLSIIFLVGLSLSIILIAHQSADAISMKEKK